MLIFMNIRLPTRDEIHRVFLEGEEAIVELFAQVDQQVEGLARQLEAQAAMLKDLQARVACGAIRSGRQDLGDLFPDAAFATRPSGHGRCRDSTRVYRAGGP